ncbi:MAG: Gfo/Idh/MocA family protein [Armatimonadota bacterium]
MSLGMAIVGSGSMGQRHAHSCIQGGVDVRLTHVVSAHQEHAEALANSLPGRVAATTEYQAVLDDPAVDIVDICIPTALHCEFTLRAARAGKHVLCEKPMAVTLDEADAMIAACREAGVQLMIAHVLRFWPGYVAAVDAIKAGRIGAVRSIGCRRLSHAIPRGTSPSWFFDPARGGGAVRDLAVHDYDVINWLAGLPTQVAAVGDVNHFSALLTLRGGVFAQVEASFRMPTSNSSAMTLRVVGEEGVVTLDGKTNRLTCLLPDADTGSVTVVEEYPGDPYYNEIAYFVDCVRTQAPPERCTPVDAREALALAIRVQHELEQTTPLQ